MSLRSSLGILGHLAGWLKALRLSSNVPAVFFRFFCLREGEMYDRVPFN